MTMLNYTQLRNNLIKQFEGQVLWIYTDHRGYPTIGWGFNIQGDTSLRDAVFTELDIPDGGRDLGLRRALSDAIAAYSTPNQTAESNPLKTQLDSILSAYAPALLQAGYTIQTTFELTEAQIATVFESGAPAREDALDLWLDGMAVDAGQRAALFSLTWNNYIRADGTGSPSLKSALVRGDRAEAWYEIRYNIPDGNHGRHFAEAQVFGLYSDPLNVSDTEAEQVLQMYLTHKNDILSKNSDVAGTYRNANAYLNNANVVSEITGQEKADTLGQILKPVANYILENYTPAEVQRLARSGAGFSGDVVLGFETQHSSESEKSIQPVYRAIYNASPKDESSLVEGVTGINDLLVGINGNSYTMQGLYGNDMIIGADMNDVLYGDYKDGRTGDSNDTLIGAGGNDTLYGQDGHDLLVGGAGIDKLEGGKGSDQLLGGADNDTYIFNGDFGRDIVIDSDGSGTIVIDGTTLSAVKQTVKNGIAYRDSTNTVEVIKFDEGGSTSLLVTSLTNRDNSIHIKNWKEGELGIHLAPFEPKEITGLKQVSGTGAKDALYAERGKYLNDRGIEQIGNYVASEIHGGESKDYIAGSYGADRLYGDGGNDWITAEGGHLIIAEDPLPTTRGGDYIDGGDGDDVITGRAWSGAEWHGGDGKDMLQIAHSITVILA